MTFTYSAGPTQDAQACASIIRAWGAETPWMVLLADLDPMAAHWAGLLETHPAWVAERNGQIAGFCLRDDDTVGGLYVAWAARGQGVGKRLLDLAREGCARIALWACEANTEARRFYRREGLVEVCREGEESARLVNVELRWTRPG